MLSIATVLGVIGVLSSSTRLSSSSDCNFYPELAAALVDPDSGTVAACLKSWGELPVYMRVSGAELVLLPAMLSSQDLATEAGASHQRMDLVSERAARTFEALLGLKLSEQHDFSDEEGRQRVHNEARQLLAGYGLGALAMAKELHGAGYDEKVSAEFAGRMQVGRSPNAEDSARTMLQFLRTWYPIGRSLAEFEQTCGVRGEGTGERREYRFDTGYGGLLVTIYLAEGHQIRAVRCAALY